LHTNYPPGDSKRRIPYITSIFQAKKTSKSAACCVGFSSYKLEDMAMGIWILENKNNIVVKNQIMSLPTIRSLGFCYAFGRSSRENMKLNVVNSFRASVMNENMMYFIF